MQSFLDKVHIGLTKDSLSIVDEQLNAEDIFAQYLVSMLSSLCHKPCEDAQSAPAQTINNYRPRLFLKMGGRETS